jgi:hypothetical protein
MKPLQPNEIKITGKWEIVDGSIASNEDCVRIEEIVRTRFTLISRDSSGWEALYRDVEDGRLWELTYPESSYQGGGPPELRCLSVAEAKSKYGDDIDFK